MLASTSTPYTFIVLIDYRGISELINRKLNWILKLAIRILNPTAKLLIYIQLAIFII